MAGTIYSQIRKVINGFEFAFLLPIDSIRLQFCVSKLRHTWKVYRFCHLLDSYVVADPIRIPSPEQDSNARLDYS